MEELSSPSTVDPVEVANCYSLVAWLASPGLSSLSTLSWQEHRGWGGGVSYF